MSRLWSTLFFFAGQILKSVRYYNSAYMILWTVKSKEEKMKGLRYEEDY